MQKTILIIAFLFSFAFGDIEWIYDYDDAVEIAQKDKKMIMVMLSSEGCPACKYMKENVLKNDNVSKIVKKSYVAVYLDIYKSFLPDELTYFATPTFYFLDSDEKVLHKTVGGINAQSFLDEIELIE
ncbi:MAG: thioredoxin family protein [Campylobacterota bacterium]